VKSVNTRNL